jgi:hypothetical protein
MATIARTSEAQHDVDLERTRRTFLFAREQVSSNTCPSAPIRRTSRPA